MTTLEVYLIIGAAIIIVFLPYLHHLWWLRREKRATIKAFELILDQLNKRES